MTTEREVKLLADLSFVIPPLGDGELSVVVLDERRLDATYYDTEDLRLTRWGASLRFRKGDGSPLGIWTVKLPESRDDSLLVRGEHAFDGAADRVPDGARSLVTAYARTRPLHSVARLVTRRRRWELRDERANRLLEIDDDNVAIYNGRRIRERFREIEIELHEDASKKLLGSVVERMCAAGASPSTQQSKVARALGIEHVDGELQQGELEKNARVGDVVAAALRGSVRRLLTHDPAVRVGDDAEHVHKARVSVRRLRSDLKTFRKYLDPDVADKLREQLREPADALGRVRDADVLYERLAKKASALPRRDARATATLLRKVSSERTAARKALLAYMDSSGYAALIERLVATAEAPPLRQRALKETARKALPATVAAPWLDLERAVDRLGKRPAAEELHRIRIKVKRVRYAAEAVAPALGKDAAKLAHAMATLQGVLGELQDAAVAEDWLRDKGLTAAPSAALAAGELIFVEREAIAEAIRSWNDAWKKASKKSLRSWLC